MVALDRFQLIHSRPGEDGKEELVTRWLETGDMVLFGNHLMHSGGANPEEKSVSYRVFGNFVVAACRRYSLKVKTKTNLL